MHLAELISAGMTFFAEGMLWLWTALLLASAYVVLWPSLSKTATAAATISSTRLHGTEELTPARSLSNPLPSRPDAGRTLRSLQ